MFPPHFVEGDALLDFGSAHVEILADMNYAHTYVPEFHDFFDLFVGGHCA